MVDISWQKGKECVCVCWWMWVGGGKKIHTGMEMERA